MTMKSIATWITLAACVLIGVVTTDAATVISHAGANGVGDEGVVGQVLWIPDGNPADGDTLVIGAVTFEFDDNESVTEGRTLVTIGAELTDTLDAMEVAIEEGAASYDGKNDDDLTLLISTADGPGGSYAAGIAPTVTASAVGDTVTTINAGRVANKKQSSGRIVLDAASAAMSAIPQRTTFIPAFATCAFYDTTGAPKTTTATCKVDTSYTPDVLVIDPTAGETPLAATDVVIWTVWE